MKKIKCILSCFLLVIIINSNAQEFKYGAEIGLDISKPQFSSYSTSRGCFCGPFANSNYYALPSANINGYIELKANDIWGISAEPGFISKDGFLKANQSKIKMFAFNNYLQLPVLFNLYIKKKLFFSLGMEMSMLMFKFITETPTYFWRYPYQLNSFELSGIIGTGYSINDHFDIGLRYSRGFTNIIRSPYPSIYGSLHNQYAQLFVRYKK